MNMKISMKNKIKGWCSEKALRSYLGNEWEKKDLVFMDNVTRIN